MKLKRISQIHPGDLICDKKPGRGRTYPVLIISISQEEVLFLLAGDCYLYSASPTQEEYFLLSRKKEN